MKVQGVVEVRPDASGAIPSALLLAAYQSSAAGAVMLVLNGTTPSHVDRALDRIVRRDGTGVEGVRYVDVQHAEVIVAAARGADFVVASSPELRARLALVDGVRLLDPQQWERERSHAAARSGIALASHATASSLIATPA